MVFAFGGTLAFFFELLLLSKKDKSIAHTVLSTWMLFLGIHLFLYYFSSTGLDFKHPHLLGLGIPLPLLHGPFLYLYTGTVTGIISWKPRQLLHFVPFLVFYVYYSPFFILPETQKVAYVKQLIDHPDLFFTMLYPAFILSGFSYMLFTIGLFQKHKRNILANLSNSNAKNNLSWLRNLIIGLSAIWFIVLLSDFVLDQNIQDQVIHGSVVLFVASIGYFGIKQGNIFIPQAHNPVPEEQLEIEPTKYSKSGLKEDKALEVQAQLLQLMETEKRYLDENLSLPQLADLLQIHPNYLSQIINERFQKNFYDFVNAYRIEEFQRLVLLEASKKLTFFALACDCGFNSKASFNNAFKKFTGMTPSEYVKSSEKQNTPQNT